MADNSGPHPPSGPPAAPNVPAPPLPTAPAATGAASAAPASAARFSKAPRTFAAGPAPPLAPGQPDMLRLVRNHSFYTVERLETSTYIPSFLMMFLVLAQMDQQIVYNFSFGRSAPNWHPFFSHLYISVLCFIHVLRVMDGILQLPDFVKNFYETFINSFPLDSLLVPGPLVPFFESITAFESQFEWIGNICATWPDIIPNQLNRLDTAESFQAIWPNILFLLDQVRDIADTAPPANFDDHRYFHHIFGTAAQAANHWTQVFMTSLHARYVPWVPEARYNAARSFIQRSDFWTRAELNATLPVSTLLNFNNLIGFITPNGDYRHWFQQISPMMAIYCKHFENSVSLSRLSTRGLGAPSIIWNPSLGSRFWPPAPRPTATAGTVPAHYRPADPRSSTMTGSSRDHTTEELAEQYSMLTAVNVDMANTAVVFIANNTLRRGSYWNYMNVVRNILNLNIYPGIALTIRDFYLKERIN
jgi:hypothetical protein